MGANTDGAGALARLDEDIAAARADGLFVILTLWGFPTWANGTAGVPEASWHLPDRVPQSAYIANSSDPQGRKPLEMKFPSDTSVQSPWGQFVVWIYNRYNANNPARPGPANVQALEVCNEPNVLYWPQQTDPPTWDPTQQAAWGQTSTVLQCFVSQMMLTAASIGAYAGHGIPFIFGPASTDAIGGSRRTTPGLTFTNDLLGALENLGYIGLPNNTMWTHHNYNDIEMPDTQTRASQVQQAIQNRWNGWSEGGVKSVFLTEGGARQNVVGGLAAQAAALGNAYDRVKNDTARLGRGIGMFTQYLYITDGSGNPFDCGIMELNGTQRPAYATWKGKTGSP